MSLATELSYQRDIRNLEAEIDRLRGALGGDANLAVAGMLSDKLQQCETELARRQPSGWVSVDASDPMDDDAYIVCWSDGMTLHVGMCEFNYPKWQGTRVITHWMPLPQPPKQTEDTK